MITANDIKINIIHEITQINDLETLNRIYKNLTKCKPISKNTTVFKSTYAFKDATVEIRTGVTFKEILKAQNYTPINYQEFRVMADKIKWKHSLEELLGAID